MAESVGLPEMLEEYDWPSLVCEMPMRNRREVNILDANRATEELMISLHQVWRGM
jgi:hypothetical protein